MMTARLMIAQRFNGPPNSGNGGYVCGVLAQHFDGAAEISLRAPPPLDTPLILAREGDSVALRHGEVLLAEAKSAALTLEVPPAPTLQQAHAAAKRYVGRLNHRYPTCFVCGCGREPADGLEIYTGPVEGRDMVAAPWTPGDDLADDDGLLAEEFIHAALDCPSYWALPSAGQFNALLGRMIARVDRRPKTGETLIVAAWPISSEGRKHRGGAALYTSEGAILAAAEALWIEPKAS